MSPVRLRAWMPRLITCAGLAAMLVATLAWAADKAATKDAAKSAPAASAATVASKDDAAKQQKEMDEMMKMAAPGPNHEKLKECVGSWKASVKSFWTGQPQVSEGTAEMQMILGGRYLEQRFKGTMMNMPFEGYGLTGFDKAKGSYQSVWLDNSSTGMMFTEGTTSDDGKTVTMKGMGMGMDGKPAPMRTEFKMIDANTNMFMLYGDMGGKEAMLMEITYKKAS